MMAIESCHGGKIRENRITAVSQDFELAQFYREKTEANDPYNDKKSDDSFGSLVIHGCCLLL
jgi:hypothetical protein